MAKIIVVSNQKGGCGKTTITMNLAANLSKAGFSVLIIDGDPQGSALSWASSAEEDSPFPAHMCNLTGTESKAHTEIKKYLNNYDYIIVDCPPSKDSEFTGSALLVADLALIPIIPSPSDVRASIPFEKLIKNVSTINDKLKAVFVVNMVRAGESIGQDAITLIDNDFEIKRLKTLINLRTSYKQASLGGSVFDGKDTKAITEIKNLTSEVLATLCV